MKSQNPCCHDSVYVLSPSASSMRLAWRKACCTCTCSRPRSYSIPFFLSTLIPFIALFQLTRISNIVMDNHAHDTAFGSTAICHPALAPPRSAKQDLHAFLIRTSSLLHLPLLSRVSVFHATHSTPRQSFQKIVIKLGKAFRSQTMSCRIRQTLYLAGIS